MRKYQTLEERLEEKMQEIKDKPLALLTVGEFFEILDWKRPEKEEKPETVYLHGIKEVANYLKVSASTVIRLRKERVFDSATIERGKILLFDRDKLMECLNHKNDFKFRKFRR